MDQSSFNTTALLARCTRWLQARFSHHPLKGLTRFSNWVNRWIPPYRGTIEIQKGIKFHVNSIQSAERWLLFSGDYQPALTDVLKKYTPLGGTCLDIGANLGFYTVSMARWVSQTGHVIAFEANPDMVQRIEQNVALNQFPWVEVVSAAVNDEPGTLDFYVSNSPGKSSIHQINSAVDKIVVPALTIDDYSRDHGWTSLDVIKMDIEGNDCQALIGARKTLTRFRPFIIFEYKRITPTLVAKEAFALLESLNYEIWALSLDGIKTPFDLNTTGTVHSDVMCIPPDR